MREVCMKCGEEFKKENMIIDIDTCLCEECYQYAKEEKDMCNHCEYFKFDAEYSDYRECVNKESEYKGMNLWNLPIDMACEYYEPVKYDIIKQNEYIINIDDKTDIIDESIEQLAIIRRKIMNETIDNDTVKDSLNLIIEELSKLRI